MEHKGTEASESRGENRNIEISEETNAEASNEVFFKRAGTTNRGKEYEDLLTALITLRLIDQSKEFRITSNVAQYGAFDDLVLDVTSTTNTREFFALQLKHGNSIRNVSSNALCAVQGNYSIQKYFHEYMRTSVLDNYRLIIFTNHMFNIPSNSLIKLSGKDFKIKIVECQSVMWLNTFGLRGQGRCYQFEICDAVHTTEMQDYQEFFKKFYLYTDQADAKKLKNDIFIEFKQVATSDKDTFEKYLKFVTTWSMKEGKKNVLKKSLMETVITMLTLSPFITPFLFCNRGVNNKMKLLRETISKFDITFFQENICDKVVKLWEDTRDELTKNMEIVDANIIKNQYQITSDYIKTIDDLTNEELTKFLWVMGKCPLIVKANKISLKAINLCNKGKFILLDGNKIHKQQLNKFSIFQDLSDLNPISSEYKELLQACTCSLQGKKEITLESLIDQNEQFRKFVTANELVQMLQGPLIIGGKKEQLPEPHVTRSLSRNIISYKFFDSTDKDTVLIISHMQNFEKIKHYLTNFNVINIEEYVTKKSNHSKYHKSEKEIYISENDCSQDIFEEICNRNKFKKTFHHFKMTADEKMEWVRSKGGVSDLEEYRLESGSIKETDIYSHEAENKINIICSDAGMGKSILMKNLKNNQPPNIWTIIIYSKDVSSYFREKNKSTNNIDDFISYIIKKTSKKYTDFDSDIVEILRKNNQMVYIWDGLDEISDQNLNNVLDFVAKLSKRGILQWITARCHLKKPLENKFSVLSRTLRKFTDEEQDEYIKERLTHFCPKNELKDIIEKIKYNVKMVQHNDILGIPLQIYMFTELFQQDLEKYKKLLNSIFSITDLYHHFVDEKFNHYYKEKANIKNRNDLTERILDEHKKSRLKKYEKVALKMYFEQNILEDLKINCENFLKRIQEDNDCIGIITEVTENRIPNFWHPSYGEYFAATYFSKNYQRIPKFKEFIFKERYSNVRFLFDLLLAKNFPAHIATLYKNLTVLKNHKEKIKDKDLGGRNPLQLASSWGERYPILNVEHKNDVYVIDDAKGSSVKEENPEYRDILNYLSDKCDIKQVDKMFQMDSLLYADTSLCLLPIVILSGHQRINFHDFKNFNEICTTLYYSVKFGYANIFNLIQEVPYIETKERRSSLLHLSVEYGKLNCLEKILKIGHYKEVINKGDKYGFTPTHIASQKGYADIVKMLIMSEANVNNTDQDKATPIYVASQVGHENIVILLINSGAAVNDSNKSASTPLHAAAQNGHFGVAVALVTSGAKVNLIDKNGATPLYLASQNGHFNIVELLIKSDANVNIADKNKSTPIYTASQGGYYNIVKLLIQSGAETNTCSNDGTTPLHVASQNGHKNVVRLLINSNTFIDCSDKSKATPLYTASENGRTEVVQLLIGSGANINISNKFGYTPVYIASQKKHTTIVQLLVDFKADVNTSGDGGWTPIFVICANGHLEILQILINCGAHINQIDSRGTTPLFIACQNGHIDIAEKLISCGALVNSSDSPIFVASQKGYANIVQLLVDSGADVNICNQFGTTPLHSAAQNCHIKVVDILIKYDAVVDCIDENGSTPLYVASQKGYPNIVQLLIKSGAKVNGANKHNISPLYVASQEGHSEVVQLLIKAGANVQIAKEDGTTPIYVASQKGHNNVVQLLLKAQANVDRKSNDGKTPVYVASEEGHGEVVKMLIEHKANLNSTDIKGWTPIHVACKNGHFDVVEMLIQSEVDVNITNKDDTTPVHVASENGHVRIVQLLKDSGAKINSTDKDGTTPIHIASQNGQMEVVQLLLSYGATADSINKYGLTAVQMAAQNGHSSVVELLNNS